MGFETRAEYEARLKTIVADVNANLDVIAFEEQYHNL